MLRLGRLALALVVWALVAVPAWLLLFLHSSTEVVVAGHDARVTPTLDSHAVLETGPWLPDVRMPLEEPVGVRIVIGKTTATTTSEVVARYAAIATHPSAETRVVARVVRDQAVDAAVRAALVGLLPLALWWLVGPVRRREVLAAMRRPSYAVVGVGGLALAVVAVTLPWRPDGERVRESTWLPLPQALPEISLPADLAVVEIQGGVVTAQTRRLVASAADTYEKSRSFYTDVRDRVADVADELRTPDKDEVVGVLVSDRHDNVGMDQVARAIGDAAGATLVIDAGDDTSTGSSWEAFSLDSLDSAFEGYDDRLFVAGNHDHGSFVATYLRRLHWTHLDGSPTTVQGIRFLGVDDPRSSGLGNWRDEKGLSFAEVGARLSEEVCRLDSSGDRIATVVVHDANLAKQALAEGCTDLVVGGHLHVQRGPTPSGGGHSYTNGTTGGAAYAIAVGSKLRREAEVSLVTWRGGKPVGIQPVLVDTTGLVSVGEYVPLG